jgi:hypothetical protein
MKRESVSAKSRESPWPTRKIKPLKARRLVKHDVGYAEERKNDAKMKEYPVKLLIKNIP